ncbi:hypothetical protein M2371_001938 [Buttiauxella sp. BIGb0471]|nr:hypothetical protein [Buttiauxella sp. BIGb0471]
MPFKFSLFMGWYFFATFYAATTLGTQIGDAILEGSRIVHAIISIVIIVPMFLLSRQFFQILKQHFLNDKNSL